MDDFQDSDMLVKSLRSGEERAFVYLFDNYYDGLVNYAGRIVREAELANDLVQSTFCKLYEVDTIGDGSKWNEQNRNIFLIHDGTKLL